jgi:hypothetical protein
MDQLCEVLTVNHSNGTSSDLFLGLRCFTMDTITSFCFARSVNAIAAPGFRAPIVEAMEACLPSFVLFRHFGPIRKFVMGLPAWLSVILSPATAGLVHLQQILGQQVRDVCDNPELLKEAPHPIIYHALLNPEVNKGRPVPSPGSLYEEAQALMFGGGDTTGNTLMIGVLNILERPDILKKLKGELLICWPDLASPPTFETLEKLRFLVISQETNSSDSRMGTNWNYDRMLS